MARGPENHQEAAGQARGPGAQEAPGSPGCPATAAAPPSTPEQARVMRLNRMGIPASVAGEAPWSADIFSSTLQATLARGR